MHRGTAGLFILVLLFGLGATAMAANTDSHTVTVTVAAINEIDVDTNVTLTVNSATAGQDPDVVTDNTSADLKWTTNEASKKITVATNLAAPNFSLTAQAVNISGSGTPGTAAGAVTLSTTAADLITGISTSAASCDLQFVASATAAQGTGSDVHTVTYTLTDS